MIRLKSILSEVFNEAREKGRSSGTYEYSIEFDGQFIPGLAKDTDTIEVSVDIPYNYDPGYGPTRWQPGEGASVELEDADITGITIHSEEEEETEIDVRFLHSRQQKLLQDLVDSEIEKNLQDIQSSILDGIGD